MSHLETHLAQTALLNETQRAAYPKLRGYDLGHTLHAHQENPMKRMILKRACAIVVVALLPLAATAAGDAATATPAAVDTVAGKTDSAAAGTTLAEVKKIDKDAKKITLKHEEIKSLDMPPMTMVFQVKDPAILEGLKPGDKVKFRAEKAKSGYSVSSIESLK
jgi:Cu(I)/Ag(I) efflux system periplasmic protein CusF